MGWDGDSVTDLDTHQKDASCLGPKPAVLLWQLLVCLWVGGGDGGNPLERFGILGWTSFRIF